ncbi:MAG: hypothetical protein PHC88_04400 [Terrimicrobiaceae bacterium]|nr:hypothetical protein [Terrimicrobiaceae bacterium]
MIRSLFPAATLLVVATTLLQAQVSNSPVKITDIKSSLEKTPEFTISIGPQRKATSQDWLWIEVSFTYQSPVRNAPPIDDLTLNYYVLLNDVSAQNRTGTLLTGTIIHTGVTSGTDVHHSVALVSPQTLKRFFGARPPASVASATQAIGVTASVQGQLVAEMSTGKGKGSPSWWNKFQQGPAGLVLSKDQTPFAPLFYDYFDAVKAKAGN